MGPARGLGEEAVVAVADVAGVLLVPLRLEYRHGLLFLRSALSKRQ